MLAQLLYIFFRIFCFYQKYKGLAPVKIISVTLDIQGKTSWSGFDCCCFTHLNSLLQLGCWKVFITYCLIQIDSKQTNQQTHSSEPLNPAVLTVWPSPKHTSQSHSTQQDRQYDHPPNTPLWATQSSSVDRMTVPQFDIQKRSYNTKKVTRQSSYILSLQPRKTPAHLQKNRCVFQ